MPKDNFHGSLTGTVVPRKWATGSKSENTAYFIVFDQPQDGGTSHITQRRLELRGENPFEQPTLKALAGKRVRATGGHWIGDLWRAAAIEEIEPAPKPKRKRPKRSPLRAK